MIEYIWDHNLTKCVDYTGVLIFKCPGLTGFILSKSIAFSNNTRGVHQVGKGVVPSHVLVTGFDKPVWQARRGL